MADQEILTIFAQLLGDLLFDDTLVLTESTVRSDVRGWDSFAYVNFIVVVEMRFGIKFSVAEIESFETVGDIANRTKELAAK